MEAKYLWVPFYEELAKKLLQYRGRQGELIQALSAAKVNAGLVDQDPAGTEVPLAEIDPFTFFGLINKHFNSAERSSRTASLKDQFGLASENPVAFSGVPTSDPRKSWFFPFKYERSPSDVPALWRLFEEVMAGKVADASLEKALQIKWVGKSKLTQGMFWVSPQNFFPVDSQTKPYLEKLGLASDFNTAEEYLALCEAVKQQTGKPLYEVSDEAFLMNQASQKNKNPPPAATGVAQKIGAYDVKAPTQPPSLNTILFGPPGTGKTYETKRLAVEICEGGAPKERMAVLTAYEKLRQQNRVEFVTFHQSFSYEDFVEGLRPVIDDDSDKGEAEYECRPGVFKRICTAAEAALNPKTVSSGGVPSG